MHVVPTSESVRRDRRIQSRRGFTLVEIITALGIIAIAASISISLLTETQSISLANRHRALAQELATEQLARLQADHGLVQWPSHGTLAEAKPGDIIELPSVQFGRQFFPLPMTKPTNQSSHDRMRDMYTRYQWSAFLTVPEPGAATADLTVVVAWTLQGTDRNTVLTTAVPASALEDRS